MRRYIRSDSRRWSDLFMAHVGWGAIAGAALLMLMVLIGFWQSFADQRVFAQSVPVEARILTYAPAPSGSQYEKLATFGYMVAGQRIDTTIKVDYTYQNENPIGGLTTLYYSANDPARVRESLVDVTSAGTRFQRIVGFAALLALCVGGWAGLKANSAVRARNSGRMGTARVEEIEPTSFLECPGYWWDFKSERVKARLVFIDNFGKRYKSLPHPRSYLKHWKQGDLINVYVGSKRSWWDGDVGARKSSSAMPSANAGPAE